MLDLYRHPGEKIDLVKCQCVLALWAIRGKIERERGREKKRGRGREIEGDVSKIFYRTSIGMQSIKINVAPTETANDKSKIFFSPFAIFKKKINLTIDTLSPGIFAPGPQLSTYRPRILRGVRI